MMPETEERPSANNLKFATSIPSAASAERISRPAASSPARPQNAMEPPSRAPVTAAFAAMPPPSVA